MKNQRYDLDFPVPPFAGHFKLKKILLDLFIKVNQIKDGMIVIPEFLEFSIMVFGIGGSIIIGMMDPIVCVQWDHLEFNGTMKPAKSVTERIKMSKITTCHCGEDGYYSCVELREQLELARNQLQEAISAAEEYIHAIDYARRWYHDSTLWRYDGLDDRIDAAEQRLWTLKEEVNKPIEEIK